MVHVGYLELRRGGKHEEEDESGQAWASAGILSAGCKLFKGELQFMARRLRKVLKIETQLLKVSISLSHYVLSLLRSLVDSFIAMYC